MTHLGGYDRLAMAYPLLEAIMFGGSLAKTREQACHHFIEEIPTPKRVLLLGDGRGQCLLPLAQHWHEASFVSVDRSKSMLRYQQRIIDQGRWENVELRHSDVTEKGGVNPLDDSNAIDEVSANGETFDVVVMPMFADCFSAEQLTDLFSQLSRQILPGWHLAYLDFVAANRAVDRLRLWAMHRFFRVATDLQNRSLVPVEPILRRQRFTKLSRRHYQSGLLVSEIYRSPV